MWHPKLLFFLAIHTFRRRKLSPSNLKLDSLRSESDRSELLLKITICCFLLGFGTKFVIRASTMTCKPGLCRHMSTTRFCVISSIRLCVFIHSVTSFEYKMFAATLHMPLSCSCWLWPLVHTAPLLLAILAHDRVTARNAQGCLARR